MKHGYLSSTGRCFDIGTATEAALGRFSRPAIRGRHARSRSAGNGSLMRLAPVPMFFHPNIKAAIDWPARVPE